MYKLKLFSLFLSIILNANKLFAQKDPYLIHTFKEHTDEVHSISFNPNTDKFISGSKDESIIIWDLIERKSIKTLKRHYATIYELEYTADGEKFVSGGDKSINIWHKNGDFIQTMKGHITSVWSVGISHKNKYLVSGSFDNNFRLWDVDKNETSHIFENGKKSVLAVAYSQANNLIACGAADGSIQIYTFDNFELIHELSGHGSNIYALDFSPDGKQLASASRDSQIKIWDMDSMSIFKVLSGHERSVMSIKFSSNGKYIVSGSYDASVRLWDVISGQEIHSFLDHTMPVNDVDISSDNKYILSASSDKTIKLWELNPELLVEFYFGKEYQSELNKLNLFDPKQKGESRSEYKLRQEKAEKYKNEVLKEFIQKLNNSN